VSVTMRCAVGHMLENPVNPPLLVVQIVNRSDNVRGAENQQERLWESEAIRIPENPQRPYADRLVVNAAR